MPLPKIDIPAYTTTLPSTKKEVRFRPFLVKEEKILLMANQGDDENEKVNAINQIVNNCKKTELDTRYLPTFDIEWLFLQLRIHSVGDIIDMRFQHTDTDKPCKHITESKLNLKDVVVKYDPTHNKNIKITDDITLILKYPKLDASLFTLSMDDPDKIIDFLSSGIEFIKEGEKLHETKDYTKEERKEFFEQLTQQQMQMVQNFYETQPRIEHELKYKCEACGSQETVILRGLQDFLG